MISDEIKSARLRLVEEHVRSENAHDLAAILNTFGASAAYEDEPWNDRRTGRDGVQSYYEEAMRALPDLAVDVRQRYVTDANVILEVVIRGTHLGMWRGLPPTGRTVAIPLCAIYSFDDSGKLARERIYYDRATVFTQLGLFHDPASVLGRAVTALTHPVTMLRIAARRMRHTDS